MEKHKATCANCNAVFLAMEPDEVLLCAGCAGHCALSEKIVHFPDWEAAEDLMFCGMPGSEDLAMSGLNSNVTCSGCRGKMRALGLAYREARERVLGRRDRD